ncbi:8743_t:CDS:10 [Scutellospora calospora]|uniref:8743_t:CDS:1 n=1 Tax=Scutellospora calospora TaxID=85575 RepID=A0ACA9JTZ0_9GLOM|nr:8743_t:CDS:10 [Scutellospora calospora]
MSQNKYLRLEENDLVEEELELQEISNKSLDNVDEINYGLRNRTSTGDLDDNGYLLDDSKTSIDSESLENSPIPMVAAAVSVKDDPSLPCTTFRFWILSTVFTSLGAAVSEFYYFRSNGGGYSIFFVLLVSYIIGRWMAHFLPMREFKFYKWKFTLNPGPFNVKEHVLIAVAAGAGGGSAYGTDIIAIQDLFYNQHPGFIIGMLLLMSTQMIGYGLAGFLRKFRMGSGYHGLGILNFSLDWNAIGQPGPLYTPWWAQVNWYAGVIIGAWIIAPILYYNDFWMAKKFPILATYSLNHDGESVTFAVGYFYSFIAFTAAITHVILFYGDEIWNRFKASRSEEVEDIHCKMMRNYEEIPNWWYACIFVSMLFIAVILCDVSGAHLPWWGLMIAVSIACFMVLPIGIIQAVSNNQVGLNVITEMICGYIFPGLPIANVYFKCYGYMAMYQCLSFVSDLKLGHYMKIPPKAMFTAQLWGTVVGAFVNYWILQLIIYAKRPFLDGTMKDPTGQWTGYRSQVFNTASIVWGLIGPERNFGSVSFPEWWGNNLETQGERCFESSTSS